MIWKRSKDLEVRVEELEALLVQHRELLSKLQEENRALKETLGDAERRLKSLLKVFFPELYYERRPSDILEMIAALADGLDSWRSRLLATEAARTIVSPEASGQTYVEPGRGSRVDPARVRARLSRLSEEERGALELVFKGYCTVKSLAEELGVTRSRADKLLNSLQRQGFLDVLKVKTPRDARGFDVFFPSPHGETACEVLLGKPWSLLHTEELKERGLYVDNERLIREVELRLKHSGYSRVVTEFEDPSECTFRWSQGSHRADLVVYALDSSGREVKVYLECESMSNPLHQVSKMLDAYYEVYGKIYVVVSSGIAKRMMLQRVAYWAWRRREPEGLVFETRIEAIDRLTRLGYMPKYLVIRPPAR